MFKPTLAHTRDTFGHTKPEKSKESVIAWPGTENNRVTISHANLQAATSCWLPFDILLFEHLPC
jgi:hypothetical protein